MKYLRVTSLAVLLSMSLLSTSNADVDYNGVLSLTPVQEHSCLAVALPVTPGQAISGISWIHNDGSVAFPNLLIMEGTEGIPPDLTQTSLVLEEITGESLAWGKVTFESPITSSTNVVYAVFQLPAFAERTGEGLGGGPGIGYIHEKGAGAAYVSSDGASWTRLHPDFSMAVALTMSLGKVTGVRPLAELAESRPAGWWDEVDSPGASEVAGAAEDLAPVVSVDRPLAVLPNPFNPRTTVAFHVEASGNVAVDVFDVRGRRVKVLARGQYPRGAHSVVWAGIDERGASVASGVYFVHLETPTGAFVERAALVR